MELAHRIAGLSTLNVLPAARVPNAARQDCTAWVTACRRLHLRTRLRQVGETEGVRWKGYPCKELHAAAFRVAKTP